MTSITKTTTVFVPETLNPTSSSVVSGLKSQQIDYIVIGIGAVVLIIGLAFIVIALFLMCTIIIWQRKKKYVMIPFHCLKLLIYTYNLY